MAETCATCKSSTEMVCGDCHLMAYCDDECYAHHADQHEEYCSRDIWTEENVQELASMDPQIRKMLNAGKSIPAIQGYARDALPINGLVYQARVWLRLRTRKGIENLIDEINAGQLSDKQLRDVMKVAKTRGRTRAVREAAKAALSERGRGGGLGDE